MKDEMQDISFETRTKGLTILARIMAASIRRAYSKDSEPTYKRKELTDTSKSERKGQEADDGLGDVC